MNDNGDKKLSVEHRLTKVETILKVIYENDLPHLKMRLNWVIGILITLLLTIIGGLSETPNLLA